MQPGIVLSTAYLGPIQYFTKFLLGKPVWIEGQENFIKQTYRNRCFISTANGRGILIVPVKRGSFHKVHIRDIEIDYGTRWLKIHEAAILSAYRLSPYFEHYGQDILRIITSNNKFLLDLNEQLTEILLALAGIRTVVKTTGIYQPGTDNPGMDYRMVIRPKKPMDDPLFQCQPYPQVFHDRSGFLPNLSIIDALFNLGPDLAGYLATCIKKKGD
jgi:hypothetical protein